MSTSNSIAGAYNVDPIAGLAGSIGRTVTPNAGASRRLTGNFVPRSQAAALIAFSKGELTAQQIDALVGDKNELDGNGTEKRDSDHLALMALLTNGSVLLTDEQISRLMSIGTPAALSCAQQAIIERARANSKDERSSLKALAGMLGSVGSPASPDMKPSKQRMDDPLQSIGSMVNELSHRFGPLKGPSSGGNT